MIKILIPTISLLALPLLAGCGQVPRHYVYLETPNPNWGRQADLGVYPRKEIYESWWSEEEENIFGWRGERLYLEPRLPTWRAVWTHEGEDYVVIMRRRGSSFGVTEPFDIDLFDKDFKYIRSGVVNSPEGYEPYALIMARVDTDNLPAQFRNTWRLCIAFNWDRIDDEKPIQIVTYDNFRQYENNAILHMVQWDDEQHKITVGSEISKLRSIEMKSAEPGFEVTPDGRVIIPEFPDNGL